MDKCTMPDGIKICPDGVNELDPCVYKDIKVLRNCTVVISECVNCGHTEFGWLRQEDTEEVDIEDLT